MGTVSVFKTKSMIKKYLSLLGLFAGLLVQGQIIQNYTFQNDLENWTTSGNASATWTAQGANTTGAVDVEVTATGSIQSSKFYKSPESFPSGYGGKMLMVKFYAKADSFQNIRARVYLRRNGSYTSVVKASFTLTDIYDKYVLPFRVKDSDTQIKIVFEIGENTGHYYFDDISFEYYPYDLNDITQFESVVTKHFLFPVQIIQENLSTQTAVVTINIDTSQVTAPVLATQVGVNSNFRSKNSLVNRVGLYQNFGAFRFPAGSGSDMYFWDGNIPSGLSGYSGTSSRFLDVDHFAQFKQATNGHATVVVNYAYARVDTINCATRQERVTQAAGYASGFVNKLNNDLQANVKYWEVGNECYGPWENGYDVNGNIITGKEYGEDFCVFADSMKIADPNIKIGAVLSHDRFFWNKDVLREVENKADYLIFHHYLQNIETAQGTRNASEAVSNDILELLLYAKEYTSKPFGYYPVNMTEFNSQGYHTTTMANGLFIANLIATFIENRVNLATIWVNEWTINNDETHGILSKGDPNQADYTARPSYTPFYYFPKFFGSKMVQADVSGDTDIMAYASTFDDGQTGLLVMNFSDTAKPVQFNFAQSNNYDTALWYEIYADNIDQGNTKFYVNAQTSSTTGGGPEDLDLVEPYKADYTNVNTFLAKPYSLNFIVLGKLPVTEILSQPVSVSRCENENVLFSVTANGQNLSYQWQKDGVDIAGANDQTYEITGVSNSDAGDYTCEVSGDFGNLTTQAATLQVLEQTQITSQPASLVIDEGQTVQFSVTAQGSNLTYQWQKDGVDIAGATADTYTINNVQLSDAGDYSVVVSGDCGQEVSQTAVLSVTAGIEQLSALGIRVYPNPVGSKLIIDSKQISFNRIRFYDVSGKLILQKQITGKNMFFDLSHFAAGMYILNLQFDDQTVFVKIMKQ